MPELSSDTRKSTVAATSSGRSSRPNGSPLAICSSIAPGLPGLPGARPASPGVAVGPGTTVLIRMPRGASSAAHVRVSAAIAAYDAPYSPNDGSVPDAAVDPVTTTADPGAGTAASPAP